MHANDFSLPCVDQLLTPCLLLFKSRVDHNLVEMIRIAGGNPARLRPHVKTHKCGNIVSMEGLRGITKHKCATLNEALMLAENGASEVLIAYPQVGPNVRLLVEMIQRFPQCHFACIVDCIDSILALNTVLGSRLGEAGAPRSRLDVFLDIDSGMRRTGITADRAPTVVKAIVSSASLRLAGLHVYDGQNHQSDLIERRDAVERLMQPIWQLIRTLNSDGITIDSLVCGGTPTFPVFASMPVPIDLLGSNRLFVELAPGTCVLHDANYGRDYQDMSNFVPAVVALCRVVSKPGQHLLTVDLGHKALSADSPAGRRATFVGLPDAEQIQHSEEHLVLKTERAAEFNVGDSLMAIPAHICPTVALHTHFHVIDETGELVGVWPITRGRITELNALSRSDTPAMQY